MNRLSVVSHIDLWKSFTFRGGLDLPFKGRVTLLVWIKEKENKISWLLILDVEEVWWGWFF